MAIKRDYFFGTGINQFIQREMTGVFRSFLDSKVCNASINSISGERTLVVMSFTLEALSPRLQEHAKALLEGIQSEANKHP